MLDQRNIIPPAVQYEKSKDKKTLKLRAAAAAYANPSC